MKKFLAIIKSEFGISIGDDIYCIQKYNGLPIAIKKLTIAQIGFTSRSIHVKPRNSEFNKDYILGKTCFKFEVEARKKFEEMKGETK